MYLAEIHGKLSMENENKEDILTSNVFSFFKYANREIFLFRLMKFLNLNVSSEDAAQAEFQFWPSYPDGTQPDLVILVGSYYLLIEAKFHSGFGEETLYKKHQLLREIEGGEYEADGSKKTFKIIVVTGDYFFKTEIITSIPANHRAKLTWINWQKIALLIFNILEEMPDISVETRLFAEDLYKLLIKKKLRNYEGGNVLSNIERINPYERAIFFEFVTASYRGDFIGFQSSLGIMQQISSIPNSLFYQKNMANKQVTKTISHKAFFQSLSTQSGNIRESQEYLFCDWRIKT